MKVSVIIPTYNCARYIAEAIDSVLNQTYQDFEIIVVDDGSTDNTKPIVDRYLTKYTEKIYYIFQKNAGVAVARNTGIARAGGKYIALLDADDLWLPDALETMVKVLESDDSVGLVHANLKKITEDGKPLGTFKREPQYLSGCIFEHLFLRKAHIFGNAVLFRKECIDTVGLYDPNLSLLGCEDRDLWLRIAKAYKIQHIDKTIAYYRMRQSGLSRHHLNMMTGRLYVIDKFCPAGGKNRILRNKALARIYKEAGDKWLFDRDFAESRRNYLTSLKYWPFSIWPFVNLVKAVLKVKVKDFRNENP